VNSTFAGAPHKAHLPSAFLVTEATRRGSLTQSASVISVEGYDNRSTLKIIRNPIIEVT
jgi:hypothetical protein